jgi:cytoskeletal protein CcmA (bactofilin family)
MGIYISPKFNQSADLSGNFTYSIKTELDERIGNNNIFLAKPSVKFINLNFNYNNNINPIRNTNLYTFIGKISRNDKYIPNDNLYLSIEVDRINIHSGKIINPNKEGDIIMTIVAPDESYKDIFKFTNDTKTILTKSDVFQINNFDGTNIIQFDNVNKNLLFGLTSNILNTFDINSNTVNINTNNLLITDPIIKISHNNYNNTDKGIEFNYNSNKLGFFGLDKDNKSYKFLINATNNSNIVSGDYAEIEVAQITNPVSDLSINSINGNISLTAGTGKFVIINNNLDLGGNFLVNGNIDINFNNIENVNKISNGDNIIIDPSNILIIDGDLDVCGNSTFKLNVDIYENLNVLGELIVDSVVSFKSNFELDGIASLNSNVNISGNIIGNSNLNINGDSSFNSNVNISGNIIGNSNLIINGDVSLNSNVNISGNIIGNSNLIINGDVSLNSNVNISGNIIGNSNLIINGDVSLNSNVNISGNIIGNSNLIINGDVSLNSNVNISGNIIGDSNLIINGDVSLNSNVNISGNIKGTIQI